MTRILTTCFLALILGLWTADSVRAETIRLKSGTKLTGEIISHNSEELRISRKSGVMTVPYRLIRGIKPGGDTTYPKIKDLTASWEEARGPQEESRKNYVKSGRREKAASPSDTSQVELYMTQWCPYCRKMEAFLKQNGISYRRYNIEFDQAARRRYERLGGRGVPLLKVGSYTIRGYDPQAVLRALR